MLEVPCGNIESVAASKTGGADRIELCAALSLGGLTPSPGLLHEALKFDLETVVMIRPREGNFIFSPEELHCMLKDIEYFKSAGAHGIVSGILTSDGNIDFIKTKELIEAANPLPFTFHRAFDLTPDPFLSLDILKELKVNRLLTSGQAADAFSGRELIKKLVFLAENKINIIAGAGINPENVKQICEYTGVGEIHLSGRIKKKSKMNNSKPNAIMGNERIDDTLYEVTDADLIRKVRALIR